MSENSDNKKKSLANKLIFYTLCIVNLILTSFPALLLYPHPHYYGGPQPEEAAPFEWVVFFVALFWPVCAIFLFFRNNIAWNIAWFFSLLGLGVMTFILAMFLISSLKAQHAPESVMMICIFGISLILCLTVFIGLLMCRREWK